MKLSFDIGGSQAGVALAAPDGTSEDLHLALAAESVGQQVDIALGP
ncbi:hypothetical protein [Streptomyces griseus]